MLNWFRKSQPDDGPEPAPFEFADVSARPCAVLFKHSPTCAVSRFAHGQVETFKTRNPSIPVYTILVRTERALSSQIATWSKVRHESPQIIVLRAGKVVSSASHGEVTVDYLTEAVAEIAR